MQPNEMRALAEAGAAALQAGDARTARKHFERIVAAGQANAGVWTGLAVACQVLRDQAAMLQAVEQTLSLDPQNIRALVMKGDHLLASGNPRASLGFYSVAVASAARTKALPPALAQLARHAQEKHSRITQDLETHVRAHLQHVGYEPGAATARFSQSIEILMGRKQRYEQEPRAYFFPELAPIQFFPRGDFPWLAQLEAATSDICAELESVLASGQGFVPYIQRSHAAPTRNDHSLLDNPDWSAFFLWRDGAPVPGNAERCPKTLAALADLPLARIEGRTPSILFSRLSPGTRIPPHSGFLNTRLICHLPLIVPPGCHFRVGNEQRQWQKGTAWVFDDTIEHEAWNGSDQQRVILIFDIWRPELTGEEQRLVAALLAAIDTFGSSAADSWSV